MDLLFSIIIPTYNRSNLLKKTLTSLLAQSYKAFEILVVDDGGNDDTRQMVESLNDQRIKYYWKENGERGAARNYGANLAKGQYLNFFDSDDIAYENHLKTAFDFIAANNEVIAFHTSYDWKDADYKILLPSVTRRGLLNKFIFKRNILSTNNVFIRKEKFMELKFSEDRDLSGTEDWLLWLRLSCYYPLYGSNVITTALIQHDTRSMSTSTGKSTLKRTLALEKQLKSDPCLIKKQLYKPVMAEMLSLTALGFAIGKDKKEAVRYLIKASAFSHWSVYTRRTLAIIKYLLFK